MDKKMTVLSEHEKHSAHIKNQILSQSDMAIRYVYLHIHAKSKLLLELETGGNIRFEDEQKDEPWVKECEVAVKAFIKKTISKDAPRTIQIHRLSRLHNRNLKLKLDDKIGLKSDDAFSGLSLVCTTKQAEMDIFSVVEHGFGQESDLLFSNYLDCNIKKKHKDSSNAIQMRKLKRALITKVYTERVAPIKDDAESLSQVESEDYPLIDAVYIERQSTSSKPETNADPAKDFAILDRDLIIPEYFIEYSLEADNNQRMTKFERLALDIAYSNKLSHSNMPHIIGSVSSRFERGQVST